jgi:guanylate kinase
MTHDRSGRLFAIVGPAGAGKNTLIDRALERLPQLRKLPTATTRAIRPGEQEGREHFYLTRPAFEALIEQQQLLEYQTIHGNLYGMLRSTIDDALAAGDYLIADIDMLGVLAARAAYAQHITTVFVMPPSIASLMERMRGRGENPTEISRRLLRVPQEIAFADECDYSLRNDDDTIVETAEIFIGLLEATINGTTYPHVHAPFPHPHVLLVRLLLPDGRAVNAPLEVNRLPHETALNILHAALPGTPDDALHTGPAKGLFVPPLTIDIGMEGGHEVIAYVYGVQQPVGTPS